MPAAAVIDSNPLPGKWRAPRSRFSSAPSLARYRATLSACYFYTRESGRQLQRAADLAPNGELRAFFAHMAEEERDHYWLAEADLATSGFGMNGRAPAAVVLVCGLVGRSRPG